MSSSAHPAGTVIQASDRRYIVAPDGSWRVYDYRKAPDEANDGPEVPIIAQEQESAS